MAPFEDLSVAEANVLFYREIAAKYDDYETCVSDPGMQSMLNADLDRIAGLFGSRQKPVACLDCGGGSGNLSLKMLKRGWSVTVVDVSPEMLGLLEAKASRAGFAPRLINGDVSAFLEDSREQYDLVTFNSVLHHLHSYLPVVESAARHVGPRGVFYSNFDPAPAKRPALTKIFETFDTLAGKLAHDRSDLLPGTLRRLKKQFRKRDEQHGRPVVSPGDLAEYHAKTGVDDLAIIALLKTKGFSLLEHSRWPTGRTALTKAINKRLRMLESFKVIAQLS
jgi:ubiquinone/menaquinone biosynthesis C-methylase UbiE